MPRTKGSRNAKPATVKSVAVRLTAAELAKLRKVHASVSKAIHALIDRL